jgi:hypothetical protein
VLRARAGEDVDVADEGRELVVGELLELDPGDGAVGVAEAEVARDGRGGLWRDRR